MTIHSPLWRSTFSAAPFELDNDALDWVATTFASLSVDGKIGQILLPLARDLSNQALNDLLELGVGGIHRMPGRSLDELQTSAEYLQTSSKIPLLLSGDLECSEKGNFAGFPGQTNQMGVAATNDPENAARMAAMAAYEGLRRGFNWSFTPVVDIDLNFRSSVVNTRSFGSDPQKVGLAAAAYVRAMQAGGMAACAKHWPGDGCDERDQHFVTSMNTLTEAEWWATFGTAFRAAISAGVKAIMAGHISLPRFQSQPGRPASLDSELLTMLRSRFGFQGLIISDAISMGGFLSQGERAQTVPNCIQAGCDILLFPVHPRQDFEHLRRGLETGLLSHSRLDEAVLRILALKASLGLHQQRMRPVPEADRCDVHKVWEREIAERSVTLVRDTQELLPLQANRHRRILLLQTDQRHSPSGPLPSLQIDALLREAGFEVYLYGKDQAVDLGKYDVAICVVAEEGLSAKQGLRVDWTALQGRFPASMDRLWRDMPALMVSLGSPYHLFEAPDCPTLINAYSPVLTVQRAVVAALTGAIPFMGRSPVDAFAGLDPELRYDPLSVARRVVSAKGKDPAANEAAG